MLNIFDRQRERKLWNRISQYCVGKIFTAIPARSKIARPNRTVCLFALVSFRFNSSLVLTHWFFFRGAKIVELVVKCFDEVDQIKRNKINTNGNYLDAVTCYQTEIRKIRAKGGANEEKKKLWIICDLDWKFVTVSFLPYTSHRYCAHSAMVQ